MKDIEIIFIDDFSLDNSLMKIKEFMAEDPRIRLIRNNKTMQILYSKSIGALNSNGEYILELDQDDMFIRADIFDILYREAKENDLDLVQFRDFNKLSFHINKETRVDVSNYNLHFIPPKETHYKYQPELKTSFFTDNNNYLLWGLLIKSNIYKKAVLNLWPIIMNFKIVFTEDYIITFMIFNIAHNYKYINKFGIIHWMHSNSAGSHSSSKIECHQANLFYLNYLYYYYKNQDINIIKVMYNYIIFNQKLFSITYKLYKKEFEFILYILFTSEKLAFNDKKDICKIFNISSHKYNILSNYRENIDNRKFSKIKGFHNLFK